MTHILMQDIKDWYRAIFVERNAKNIYEFNQYFIQTLLRFYDSFYEEDEI